MFEFKINRCRRHNCPLAFMLFLTISADQANLNCDIKSMKQYSRHLIFCKGSDCKGKKLAQTSRELLGSSSRHVKRSTVSCLGACKQGPVVIVYPDGVWYACPNKKALRRIVEEHIEQGQVVEKYVIQTMPKPNLTD